MRQEKWETVYGVHSVLAVLRAGRRQMKHLWLAEGRGQDERLRELLELAAEHKVPVDRVPRQQLARLAGDAAHQGVVAQAARLEAPGLQGLLAGPLETALLVVLDQVQDPRNLGAILRTAAAARAHAVLVPDRRQAPLSAAAVKSAEGAAEYMPLVEVGNLNQALRRLKAAGVWIIGFAPEATRFWDEVDLTLPSALVLGSEGRGLRRLVGEACDTLVALPVAPELGSLNVAATAAAALYEAVRQRRRAGVGW